MSFLRLQLVLLLSCFYHTLHAQNFSVSTKHYGIEEGLPSNLLYCVAQDKTGYLWFGTDAGVTRFDGINFTTYTTSEGLASNDVFNIFCDSKNRLWFMTLSKEISYFYNGKIYNKNNDTLLRKIHFSSELVPVREDEAHAIWIAGKEHEIYKYEDHAITEYKRPDGFIITYILPLGKHQYLISRDGIACDSDKQFVPLRGLEYKTINDIQYLENKKLITYDTNENLHIDRLQNDRLQYHYKLKSTDLRMYHESDTSIWIRKSGLSLYHIASNQSISGTILKNRKPSFVFKDREDNTWITTLDHGLYKLFAKKSSSFIRNEPDANNTYNSVYADSSGVYAGNINGEIWKIPSHSSPQKICQLETNFGHSTRILTLSKLNNNTLVMSTDAGLNCINLTTHAVTGYPTILAIKSHFVKGDTVVSIGFSAVYSSLNGLKTIQSKIINNRFYSAGYYENNFIVGAVDGLYTYNLDTVQPYQLNIPLQARISDIKTYGPYLFLCTIDQGVFQIEHHTCIRHFDITNGLSSNSCNKIFIQNNKLCIATKRGINIIDIKTNRISYLYESDGLASNTVNDVFIYHDSLLAATDRGISLFRLSLSNHPVLPDYFISPILVNGVARWNSKFFKSHNDEDVMLHLNSISFNTESKIKHAYRIRELDSGWSYTLDHAIEIRKGLAPGRYTFETYAINSYNARSKTILIPFEIVPYFYQLPLAKILLILLIATILYFFYRYRMKIVELREQQKKEHQYKLTELELMSWRSKMNPHFIFNSLNAMQSLFEDHDFEVGNKYLANFSEILRKTIESSGNFFTTIKGEIDYQTNYLELEKVKHEGALDYSIKADPDLMNYLIPSMVLQPVIENCFKHGIRDGQQGNINIVFTKQPDTFTCTITDNGPGITGPKKNSSQGLSLVFEKINLIEKISSQRIRFSYENIIDKNGHACGLKSIFVFTYITNDKHYIESLDH